MPFEIKSLSGHYQMNASFREIILSDYLPEQLIQIDPRLIILAPFTIPKKTRKNRLQRICREWSKKITRAYPEEKENDLLEILGLFILNRFRKLSVEEVILMLNFDLTKTKAGKQIYNMGLEKGETKGVKKGLKKAVLRAAAIKWHAIPKDIEFLIKAIDKSDILNALIEKIIQSGSLDDFRKEILTICNNEG